MVLKKPVPKATGVAGEAHHYTCIIIVYQHTCAHNAYTDVIYLAYTVFPKA